MHLNCYVCRASEYLQLTRMRYNSSKYLFTQKEHDKTIDPASTSWRDPCESLSAGHSSAVARQYCHVTSAQPRSLTMLQNKIHLAEIHALSRGARSSWCRCFCRWSGGRWGHWEFAANVWAHRRKWRRRRGGAATSSGLWLHAGC